MKMLAILIPSTPERKSMLKNLMEHLSIQKEYCDTVHPTLGRAEILTDESIRFLDGGLSIGKKREKLVSEANSKYLCFLDSDDMIAGNYIETLLRLCNMDKDICTFNAIAKFKEYWSYLEMGLGNENEPTKPGLVLRSPWHICPVRTSLAQRFRFENSNYGEDWSWFKQVLDRCTTEAKTDAILYEYRHGKHSEADQINHVQSK